MDPRVVRVSTANTERAYSNNDVVVKQGSTRVTRACVTPSYIQYPRAHHVISDTIDTVSLPANLLVYRINLNMP